MSLEPEVMSRACRHPRQICEQEPPTRYHHTDQVNEGTYQPNTYQVHQWGREGEGEKAEQLNDLLKQTAPRKAEMYSMCDLRNPICHDSLTSISLILT